MVLTNDVQSSENESVLDVYGTYSHSIYHSSSIVRWFRVFRPEMSDGTSDLRRKPKIRCRRQCVLSQWSQR